VIAHGPMTGRYVALEPVDPDRHAPGLFAASRDDAVWTYLAYGPWPDAGTYRDWLRANALGADPAFYAVLVDGEPRGVVSYLRDEPEHRVVEIGHIWFGAGLARTRAATEAVHLLARRTFDECGYRRLEWKCNALNAASRRAAERFGFTYEGTFRQHMLVKGRNRDTAWYALLDGEWPRVRAAYEEWLDPANFDESGTQRSALAAYSTSR